MLSVTSSLLCGCHIPVEVRVCSPVVGVETPRSVPELQCELGGTGALLLGEEPLSIPPQELSTGKCTLCCCPSPIVCAHKVHYYWHCPQLCLSCGNACNHPGCPSVTVLPKPPHRSADEVRHWDHCSRTPGPTMEAMESAQTPAPPPHARSTATNAGPVPVPAKRAPVICSDITQALGLQGACGINPSKPPGHGLDFSPVSKTPWSLGIGSDFGPFFACGQPELVEAELGLL